MIEDIINIYYDSILKYCRSALNGDYAAAEDVTQEVFIALHKKMKRLTIDKISSCGFTVLLILKSRNTYTSTLHTFPLMI